MTQIISTTRRMTERPPGMLLHPDGPKDPYFFRVDMSEAGLGTLPVVFAGARSATKLQLLLDVTSVDKRSEAQSPRRLATGAFTAATPPLVLRRGLRRLRSTKRGAQRAHRAPNDLM